MRHVSEVLSNPLEQCGYKHGEDRKLDSTWLRFAKKKQIERQGN